MERGLQPVHPGHTYVEQNDVGVQFACEPDCLLTRARLGEHFDVSELPHQTPEPIARGRFVVND
jgi:hypothetical protein